MRNARLFILVLICMAWVQPSWSESQNQVVQEGV